MFDKKDSESIKSNGTTAPEEVGEAYKRRREESARLRNEALQRSYFEE
ncbi:MAG: hypothetical protein ACSW8B_06200 [bacterium]